MDKRPKYKPEYVEELRNYFDIPPTKSVPFTDKFGNSKMEDVPNYLPTIQGFARKIGVISLTIKNWATKRYPDNYELEDLAGELMHPEFNEMFFQLKDAQHVILVHNGLTSNYNSKFASLTAKNIIGWRDKQDQTINANVVQSNPSVQIYLPDNKRGRKK